MMTPELRAKWLEARAGRLTASRMADAMDFLKTGKPSKARCDYMKEILAERMTDHTMRHYVSPAMEWGIAHEDDAKMAYEAATGVLITDPWDVTDFGIFYHKRIEYFAASPDGLIDSDGLLETKCPTTGKYLDWMLAGVVPEEHKPQMLAQLACSGRKWCEFVAYDPRMKDPAKRLFIRRYEPSADDIANVEAAAAAFLAEADAMFQLVVEAA